MAAEKTFENKVKTFLKNNNCYHFKYWGGGQFTKAGIPDIICCCNGKFLGIEIKAMNGKPSSLQVHNLKLIDSINGYGVLLYPDQFDMFKKFISCMNEDDWTSANYYYQIMKGRWTMYDN